MASPPSPREALSGSAPLFRHSTTDRADSLPLRGEELNHDPEETPATSRRNSSSDETLNMAPDPQVGEADVEKGGLARPKGERRPTVCAEERLWKDDIILWDSKDDPANPKNWPLRRRFFITMLFGMTTMCSTFASSIFSAGVPQFSARFGISSEVAVLGTSLFVLGYVPGPIIFAPLSELLGRKIVLLPMFLFICFSAGTATSERIEAVFITRFFAGLFASAPVTTVGGGLADMFEPRERGTAVVFYSLAVVAGPTLGPVIGSAVSQTGNLGWRWTEYLVIILTSFVLLLDLIYLPETFAPVLLSNKALRLRKTTGRWALHARHEENDFSLTVFLEKNVQLPLKMIVLEPMVLAITLYNAFTYGILYMLFGAVPIIFLEGKGWTQVQASLPFLAVLAGTLIGAAINLVYSHLVFAPYLDRHGGVAPPEMRLPTMMIGGLIFPCGFYMLGWAGTVGQIFGLGFIGVAFLLIFQSGINYLIDAYTKYAASAVAANTFMRSILAVCLPFAASPLFHNLGVPIACSVLGAIAGALGAVPFLLYTFGPKLRGMSKLAASDVPKND